MREKETGEGSGNGVVKREWEKRMGQNRCAIQHGMGTGKEN